MTNRVRNQDPASSDSQKQERILCVKRIDMILDNTECQAVSFIDISPYAWLRQQEEQNKILKVLNTTVHHEMLGPLRANIEISQVLYQSLSNMRLKKLAQVLNVSSKLLLSHAQDLLDQQIIENNRFVPKYVEGSVSLAVLEIVQIVRQCNTEKNRLQIKHYTKIDGIMIRFDRHRFQQVLLNLLSNATKFQHEGVIKIYTSILFDGNDQFIEVKVQDKGPGMNTRQRQDVFKPAARDRRNPSEYISNGVGLSICKKLCEQLGGDISVSSAQNQGTTFRFTMVIPKQAKHNQLIEQKSTLIQQFQKDRVFQLVDESEAESEHEAEEAIEEIRIEDIEQGNQSPSHNNEVIHIGGTDEDSIDGELDIRSANMFADQ